MVPPAIRRLVVVVCLVAPTLLFSACSQPSAAPAGQVHTYYVAADEVKWDYVPDGTNTAMGMPFHGIEKMFVEQGPHSIGHVYWKAIYREYTDDTFTTLKPRSPEWQHAGILGPILRGEVGDTIRVVFKNHATRPYSMHPHGVFYNKDSEGAGGNDLTSGNDKGDDAVAPGQTHVYTWRIPERSGPGPSDPSSVVWLYHSHVEEMRDVNSGLIGAIIVSRKGAAGPDGRPTDVDREFVSLFEIFDESNSHYLQKNIDEFISDKKGLNKLDAKPVDEFGNFSVIGEGFVPANVKATINGYMYGNGPMPSMKKGERVRWYVITVGFGFNFHTPHWHGNVVLDHGSRTDVISIAPAQMATVDMVPDDPGIWLYHCHVSEHMEGGMVTRYEVK